MTAVLIRLLPLQPTNVPLSPLPGTPLQEKTVLDSRGGWGFPKIRGAFLCVPIMKTNSVWESILGFPGI